MIKSIELIEIPKIMCRRHETIYKKGIQLIQQKNENDNTVSPCNNVCKLDINEMYCISCYRTVNEIEYWSKYSNIKKSDILNLCEIRKTKDTSKIPQGMYCYAPIKFNDADCSLTIDVCPFWGSNHNKNQQENGFCILTGDCDWDEDSGFGLLWDQCKSCGINDPDE